jgi:magnesium-transporting ATPase (P-type)
VPNFIDWIQRVPFESTVGSKANMSSTPAGIETVDLENGGKGAPPLPAAAAAPVKDTPQEPYMTLPEIAKVHADSHIDIGNIEASRGLSSKDAAVRLDLYGRNILTPPPKIPEWKRLLLQFTNMFLLLLNGCGVLSVIAYVLTKDHINLYLAIVLFVVVFLTG